MIAQKRSDCQEKRSGPHLAGRSLFPFSLQHHDEPRAEGRQPCYDALICHHDKRPLATQLPLDRSHRQKFADMKLTIKDSNIVITTAYPDNITLEKKTLKDKQDFFEEVYGLGFEIKQKKKKQ